MRQILHMKGNVFFYDFIYILAFILFEIKIYKILVALRLWFIKLKFNFLLDGKDIFLSQNFKMFYVMFSF